MNGIKAFAIVGIATAIKTCDTSFGDYFSFLLTPAHSRVTYLCRDILSPCFGRVSIEIQE